MIYGKFKYIAQPDNTLKGINSVLDPLPVVNTNFHNDLEWGYVAISGDISNYDLSLFEFTEITQEEALTTMTNVYPSAVLLDNGFFGFPDRANNEITPNVSDEEKMLDPAKWGLNY